MIVLNNFKIIYSKPTHTSRKSLGLPHSKGSLLSTHPRLSTFFVFQKANGFTILSHNKTLTKLRTKEAA